jgi:hypothetical protein
VICTTSEEQLHQLGLHQRSTNKHMSQNPFAKILQREQGSRFFPILAPDNTNLAPSTNLAPDGGVLHILPKVAFGYRKCRSSTKPAH